jgi:hypothetical protein
MAIAAIHRQNPSLVFSRNQTYRLGELGAESRNLWVFFKEHKSKAFIEQQAADLPSYGSSSQVRRTRRYKQKAAGVLRGALKRSADRRIEGDA